MLNQVSSTDFSSKIHSLRSRNNAQRVQNNATNAIQFEGNKTNVSADKLALAYRGLNGIRTASTVSFTGSSLTGIFDELNKSMVTCKDDDMGLKGEDVGSRVDVSKLLASFRRSLPKYDDAIKTTIEVNRETNEKERSIYSTDARTQIKKGGDDDSLKFEMIVRPPRDYAEKPHKTHYIQQALDFEVSPYHIELNDNGNRVIQGTPESVYVLNTKGKLMAVLEDENDILLTNAGSIKKKNEKDGVLRINTKEYKLIEKLTEEQKKAGKKANKLDTKTLVELSTEDAVKKHRDIEEVESVKNVFTPFPITNVPKVKAKSGGSQGGGTEMVIGLERGRFVPEIIESIETFQNKIEKGEIVLDEFVPAPNAKGMQLSMLAGGFGSRAEYTNASSSKIFHGKEDGSNLTKGCFRTATGLTPMETTFISLHKAGLLDCSKGNFGIGKNIKFYYNDSHKNAGNGGFSMDMYDTMAREGRENLLILPNDAMSRMPEALNQVNAKMADKDHPAAVVMIAKEVEQDSARGALGVMKISPEGLIEEFDEKPKTFKPGYVDEKGNCFANTFQFAVSKEAFEALSIMNKYLSEAGKESRDWSKILTPVLMAVTQNDDPDAAREQIKKAVKADVPRDVIVKAKSILGNQKVYAVKTPEPWADCGTLNALYHTTMQIASGDFKLEDFERKHVIDSVNSQTGLVASSPEQKKAIEEKYEIDGQVMVVPKAKPSPKDIKDKYRWATVYYTDKHPVTK